MNNFPVSLSIEYLYYQPDRQICLFQFNCFYTQRTIRYVLLKIPIRQLIKLCSKHIIYIVCGFRLINRTYTRGTSCYSALALIVQEVCLLGNIEKLQNVFRLCLIDENLSSMKKSDPACISLSCPVAAILLSDSLNRCINCIVPPSLN